MTAKHSQKHKHGGHKARDPRDQADGDPRDREATQPPAQAEEGSGEPGLGDAATTGPASVQPEDAEGADGEEGAVAAAPAGRDTVDPEVLAELEAYRDRYLRMAAEYDNFRKRTERERLAVAARAQGQLVERLLDAVDDLQRVANLETETASAEAVLEGVRLVERKLLRILESAGLEVIEAEDQPFDPEVHEALAMVAAEQREQDDTVADVLQPGYLFKGNLIRPARVRVRRFDG